MSRLVVIAPLREGKLGRARELLGEGPPFDLEQTAFDRHEVFVTEREVVFLFEGPPGSPTLELPGEDVGLWKAAARWAECLGGRPRIARTAFTWRRIEDPEGVSWEPTPGPGDSEGGDLYAP